MYLLDDQGNVHRIDEASIICIEVSRPYTFYRTKHGKFREPRTLVEFNKIYEPLGFAQIDKKKLASLTLADKIENDNICYSDLKYLISRRKLKKIKALFDEIHPN